MMFIYMKASKERTHNDMIQYQFKSQLHVNITVTPVKYNLKNTIYSLLKGKKTRRKVLTYESD